MITQLYYFYRKHLKKHLPRSIFKKYNALFSFINNFLPQYLSNSNINENISRMSLEAKIKKIQKTKLNDLPVLKFINQTSPVISIIIPVFNKWSYTYFCLQSLAELKTKCKFEILVIDNHSEDQTAKMFQSKIKNVSYLPQATNLGFGEACNLGANMAKGEFLIFLNNDTYVLDGWLDNLVNLFLTQKNVGLVGSKLIYPDGRLQEAGGIVWKNNNACNYGRFDNPDSYKYNYVKTVDYCSGASIIIRRQLFNKLGGFDRLYAPAYYEDTDLAFQVRRAGYKTLYQPASSLVHFEGITAGKNIANSFKSYQEINQEKFFSRWENTLLQENSNDLDGNYLARDRSQTKKLVLYIDNNIPTVNHDAGSYITYEYLKILVKLGYKVVFWPIIMQKILPDTERMQQQGIEVVYGNENLEEYLSLNGKYFDFICVARPNVAEQCLSTIKKFIKGKIFYMAHDLHFMRQKQIEDQNKNDHLLSGKVMQLEKSIMQQVDQTLVFNEEEKNLIESEFLPAKAITIPWIQSIEKTSNQPCDGFVFLGGFNHPPNVEAVIWLHDKIWPLIKAALPQANIDIVGHNPPTEISAFNSADFKIIGFVENLESALQNKIFICPLITGAGFKGKIAMAMAHGCPVITTSIGASGIGLIDSESAFIVDDAQTLAKQAINLFNHIELQQKFRYNSRILLKKNYSSGNATSKMFEILC